MRNNDNKPNLIQNIIFVICSLLIFLGLWWAFIWILNNSNQRINLLPYPDEVMLAFWRLIRIPYNGVTLLDHVGASFFRVIIGCLYAFLLGVPLGMILGSNPRLDRLSRPILEVIRPIPPLAWIPFALIAFGIGLMSYSFIIFIGAFFPLLQNTYDGVKQSPQVYQDVGRSLGASRSQILWEILFPSIIPNIFTGLRVSIGIGWMCVIAAEMIGVTTAGIGYFINYMTFIGRYADMMAGMLMIGLVGLLINYFFKAMEKIFLKWV
jgi:NitT/TauT family transport system permease protein